MKSLSIGSPFLNYIQNRNRSQSIPGESMSTMTQTVTRVLNEFAPRILRDHLKLALESNLTVVIYHSVETRGGFLAKTTCSIVGGRTPSQNVTEYCWLEVYQLFMPEKFGMQLVRETFQAREYRVSTLPLTLQRVQNRKPVTLSDGLRAGLFPE